MARTRRTAKRTESTPERGSVPPRPRRPEPDEERGNEPVRAGEVFGEVFEALERAARRREQR